ncbi:MAG: methyltransferase domain-containing protein [Endomicrobiaceae bacterium]|nr:methyltransferase domain-containing protein [Endomicrobiaceae bacterium]
MTRKDFFNKCACSWDNDKNPLDAHKIKTTVIPLLDLKNNDVLLDVACGTGIFIETVKEKNKNIKITGIDFAQNMIDKATKKFPDMNFVVADVANMSFDDNSFSKVMCLNAFPHFEDKNKAIKEIARVLKKDGVFILAHTNSKHNIDNHHKKVGGLIAEDILPDNETINAILTGNGFKNIEFIDNDDVFIIKASK